jgi:hypothetical protein
MIFHCHSFNSLPTMICSALIVLATACGVRAIRSDWSLNLGQPYCNGSAMTETPIAQFSNAVRFVVIVHFYRPNVVFRPFVHFQMFMRMLMADVCCHIRPKIHVGKYVWGAKRFFFFFFAITINLIFIKQQETLDQRCMGSNFCQPSCWFFEGAGVTFSFQSGSFCGAQDNTIGNSDKALMCSLSKINVKNTRGNCEVRRRADNFWQVLSSGNCADQECAYTCLVSDKLSIAEFASANIPPMQNTGLMLSNSTDFEMCVLTKATSDGQLSSFCEIKYEAAAGWKVLSGTNACGFSCATFTSITTTTTASPTGTMATTTVTVGTTTTPVSITNVSDDLSTVSTTLSRTNSTTNSLEVSSAQTTTTSSPTNASTLPIVVNREKDDNDNDSLPLPLGAIIGGVVGGVIALILVGALVAWCVIRQRRRRQTVDRADQSMPLGDQRNRNGNDRDDHAIYRNWLAPSPSDEYASGNVTL